MLTGCSRDRIDWVTSPEILHCYTFTMTLHCKIFSVKNNGFEPRASSSATNNHAARIFFFRRRMKTKEKAKVVASVWRGKFTDFNQFLCHAMLIWLGRFWRLGWIHPFLSNNPGGLVVSVPATRSARTGFESSPGASPQSGLRGGRSLCEYCIIKIALCKTIGAARNWMNSSPQTEGTTFDFSSVFILLLRLDLKGGEGFTD